MWPAANHESYVNVCPLVKFEGGLQSLHQAGDDVMHWQEYTAATALAK